jgi:hypothetical protein
LILSSKERRKLGSEKIDSLFEERKSRRQSTIC